MLSQANPQTRFTILRPQSLFGPHDKVFIPRLAHMMHHYGSILLPHGGSALVDMTYYENAARHVAGKPGKPAISYLRGCVQHHQWRASHTAQHRAEADRRVEY